MTETLSGFLELLHLIGYFFQGHVTTRHVSARKSYLYFYNFAGETILFSYFFCYFFQLILLIKIKLLWLQTWNIFELCILTWILKINKKLNSAQNAHTTFLHSHDELTSDQISNQELNYRPFSYLLANDFISCTNNIIHYTFAWTDQFLWK